MRNIFQIDARHVLQLPSLTAVFEIDLSQGGVMRPHRFVGEADWKLQRKRLFQARDILLNEPVLLRTVGPHLLFVFVGDDTARIAARRLRHPVLFIDEEFSFAKADVAIFIVLHCVLMTVGTNRPGVQRKYLGVLVEVDMDDALIAALGTQNLHDAPVMLGRTSVWSDSIGHCRRAEPQRWFEESKPVSAALQQYRLQSRDAILGCPAGRYYAESECRYRKKFS